MIGSTANIVALGMLEKRSHSHVTFLQWLKVGLLSALLATAIAWAALLLLSPLMPDRYAEVSFDKIVKNRVFKEKNVIIEGELSATAISGKLPEKTGYKTHVLIQNMKNTAKKILVYVPEASADKIETGKEYDFKGKLTSLDGQDFAASLVLD